ncbi:XRE family transcriptional regulator [Clostridium botulinum]|nr:XRE family transcriptional regulator [Clostridium botulinum]
MSVFILFLFFTNYRFDDIIYIKFLLYEVTIMGISELGLNIKKIRAQKGWSLSKLKQESGVGYATLHDIENGKSQK